MASDIRYVPLLLGMGLDEISVPASEIPALKERVSRLSNASCEGLLSRALNCKDGEGVQDLLRHRLPIDKAWPPLDRELVVLESESETKEEAIRELVNACYVTGRTMTWKKWKTLCGRASPNTRRGLGMVSPSRIAKPQRPLPAPWRC